MSVGAFVRERFGRHEHKVAGLYRGLFMDLNDYARKLTGWAPKASKILEVGCGEGAITELLAQVYPQASILAIDITPRLGRLYRGRENGVEFRKSSIQEIAAEQSASFDLITLSDVLHHIPEEQRGEIICAISRSLAPGGHFVLKDWGRTATPMHWFCYAGDRWLTGDKVAYLTPEEALALVKGNSPRIRAVGQDFVRPWHNNYVLTFQC